MVLQNSFLLVPPELLVRIFSCLDLLSILRCQSVCKSFHQLITGSAPLQYQIELYIYGMVDGPPGIPGMESAASRLAALRAYQDAWRNLSPRRKSEIQTVDGFFGLYELYGGVWAQGVKGSESSVRLTSVPSHVRNLDYRTWELPSLGVRLIDFGMDPQNDLLLLVEEHRESDSFRIHLRTLSTGDIHPKAPDPGYLTTRFQLPSGIATWIHNLTIQIVGDSLGIAIASRLGNADLVVHSLEIWIWPIAQPISLRTLRREIGSFAFLSPELLLVASFSELITTDDDDPPSLDIYSIPCLSNSDGTTRNFTDAKLLRSLYLPTIYPQVTLYSEVIITGFTIRSDPAPIPSKEIPPAPFSYDPMHRLFVVTLDLQALTRRGIHGRQYTFFVPAFTLLNAISNKVPSTPNDDEAIGDDLSWEDWGRHGCRVIDRLAQPLGYVCYVYGMRCVLIPKSIDTEDPTLRQVMVYDFSPYVVRRERHLRRLQEEDTSHSESATPEEDMNPVHRKILEEITLLKKAPEVFGGDLTTSLPCVRTKTEGHYSYESVMIDGDNIYLMKVDGMDTLHRIEVWTM